MLETPPIALTEAMHPVTLQFRNADLERSYRLPSLHLLTVQSRIAVAVGVALYVLVGLLDQWFLPADRIASVWLIRVVAVALALAILAFTFHPLFQRFNQGPVALIGLIAIIGVICIMWLMPVEAIAQYYVGVVIVIFWTYLFLGVRFIYAAVVNVVTVAAFYFAFGVLREMPASVLSASAFFLFAASVIAGAAAYILERQRRDLFVREVALDRERERHQARALHDRLTGLPNRELLEDRLSQAIALSRRDDRGCAGFYLDLDGFKQINDQFGHEVGDLVLQIVAERLRTTLREADTVARLGGDEFFVLTHGVSTIDAVRRLAEKLVLAIEQPIKLKPGGTLPEISASIGISMFPYPDCTVHDIVHRADRAMYAVKRGGKRGYGFAGAEEAETGV